MTPRQRTLSLALPCTPELLAVGLTIDEETRMLGWDEAFLLFPARLNVNAADGALAIKRGNDKAAWSSAFAASHFDATPTNCQPSVCSSLR